MFLIDAFLIKIRVVFEAAKYHTNEIVYSIPILVYYKYDDLGEKDALAVLKDSLAWLRQKFSTGKEILRFWCYLLFPYQQNRQDRPYKLFLKAKLQY